MSTFGASIAQTLRLLPRALVVVLTLAAPVLAVPSIAGSNGNIIEAQDIGKSSGAGFVILVSLQRN